MFCLSDSCIDLSHLWILWRQGGRMTIYKLTLRLCRYHLPKLAFHCLPCSLSQTPRLTVPPLALHPSIQPLATRSIKRQARSFIRQVSVWSGNVLCESVDEYWMVLFAYFWNHLPTKTHKKEMIFVQEQRILHLECCFLAPCSCF